MTWSRVPIFVWAVLATCHCSPGHPVAPGGRVLRHLDRTAQTAFFVTEHGGAASSGRTSSGSSAIPSVHHGLARLRAGHGDAARVHPQAALRLPSGGRRMIGVALLSFFVCSTTCSRVGSTGHAAAVMLTTSSSRSPPGSCSSSPLARCEGEDPVRCANVVHPRHDVQLPHRWDHRRVLSDVPVDVTVHGSFS